VELVSGRECGDCAVCCIAPSINTEEFQKPIGIRCQHLCDGGGCSIYETRYRVCRAYHCAWRYLKFLGEEWRPDRSGVLIDLMSDRSMPERYAGRRGISLTFVRQPSKGVVRALAEYVANLIVAKVLVVLNLPGPPGEHGVHAFLNDALTEAAVSRDLARIEATLADALPSNSRIQLSGNRA
jgi:hypothetical protein